MISIVIIIPTQRQDLRYHSYLAYYLSKSIVARFFNFLAVYIEIKLLKSNLIKAQH
jgi:hypothetical protein